VERAEKEIAGLSPSRAVRALHQRIDDYSRWIDHQPNVRHQTDRSVPSDLWCLLAHHMERAGSPQSEVSDMYSRGLRGVHDQSKYFPNALVCVYNLGDRALYQSNAGDLLRSSHAPLNSVLKLTHFMNSNQNWHAFELMLDVLFSEEMPGGLSKVNCVQTIKDVFEGDSWSEKFTSYCAGSYYLRDILFEKEERAINKQLSDGNYSEAMKLHADLLQQCQLPQRVTELDYNNCRSLFEFGSYRRFMKQAVLFVDSYGSTHGYLCDQISLLMAIAESKQGNTENANNMFFKVMMERPHSMSGCRASYYLGYCAMLAGTFDVALDYFEHHTDAYPASPYRQQAMMSISRIEQVVNTR